ncbi:hypothetical protein HAX54_052578 [Datura stramonium]|uniref:PB1-like domain-containing protein n=1 Tax=Datura stramonium TaxID=4076 RepID=A0ABS8T118_DATST|nr:hypothetical protein [Datura stramonium]
MATKYINLRFHFGGILMSDVGPVYIGGNKKYAFNIDMDHLSNAEVKDYCRDFGVSNIDKMYVVVPDGGGLLKLVKNGDLLLLSALLANGGTMDIYIYHKGEVFIKNTHVSGESFETTCGVDGPNKDSTKKVGEGLNAPLSKEIELIDVRGQIQGVQTSNLIGKSIGNTNELEDEFELSNKEEDSNEDLDEDEVEPTVHDEVEEDENIDLSGDEGVATSQASTSAKRKKKQKTRSSQPTQAEHLSQPTQADDLSQSSQPNQSVHLSHLSQPTSQSKTSQPFQSGSQTRSSQPTMDSGNKNGAKKAFKRPRLVGHGVFVSNSGYI